MRIALVCRRYHPEVGGVETHVKEIAEKLAKKQHDVRVFTLANKLKDKNSNSSASNDLIKGVNVQRFESLRLSYSVEFPPSSMSREIEKFLPDIVHSHSVHTFMPYFASKLKCNSKFIITPHYLGNTISKTRKILFMLYKPYLSRALEAADRVLPTTITEKNMLTRDFSVGEEKIRIIPNGVGSDLSTIIPRREKFRILSVTRLDIKHKKLDKILKAIKILVSKYNDIQLVLVAEGPDRQQVVDLIHELGLDGKVALKIGLSREQILQEYACASVFVTASELENFGIAVAEAVAAKLKVVVPDTSALSLLVNGGHALGMELPVTPERIANRIIDCINILESEESAIGTNANTYTPYTWEDVAADLESLYLELISK